MNFEKLSDDELITFDRTNLSFEERQELQLKLNRNVLWQDIVLKGKEYRQQAISAYRFQEGCGLKEAANAIDNEYLRNE